MMVSDSSFDADRRGKAIKVLLDGLSLGNSVTLVTDERKFTIQKSLGVWFHIMTADAADD